MELLAELDVNSVAATKAGGGAGGVGAGAAAVGSGGGGQSASAGVTSAGGSGDRDGEEEVWGLLSLRWGYDKFESLLCHTWVLKKGRRAREAVSIDFRRAHMFVLL